MSATRFRLDHNTPNDIRLRRFSSKEKWAWITILCLASQNECDRGVVSGDLEDVADLCDYDYKDFLRLLEKLKSKGFVELSGDRVEVVGWEEKHELPKSAYSYRKHQDFVFERDGFKCVYCGSTKNLTLDHKVPQSRGGSHDPENLCCCCGSCNSSKGARTPQEWMEAI